MTKFRRTGSPPQPARSIASEARNWARKAARLLPNSLGEIVVNCCKLRELQWRPVVARSLGGPGKVAAAAAAPVQVGACGLLPLSFGANRGGENERTSERANGRTSERANGRTGEGANGRRGEGADERGRAAAIGARGGPSFVRLFACQVRAIESGERGNLFARPNSPLSRRIALAPSAARTSCSMRARVPSRRRRRRSNPLACRFERAFGLASLRSCARRPAPPTRLDSAPPASRVLLRAQPRRACAAR